MANVKTSVARKARKAWREKRWRNMASGYGGWRNGSWPSISRHRKWREIFSL